MQRGALMVQRCVIAIVVSLLLLWQPIRSSNAAKDDKDVPTLEPGKPIDRELGGGQSHFYQIALASGQYLHVVVDQRGIDVIVALFGPDGKLIFGVDSPTGTQ